MKKILFVLVALGLTSFASAQVVRVGAPWARATTTDQTRASVFMQLVAPQGATLIGASTPIAQRVEMHEVRKDQSSAIQAKQILAIDLPAGKPTNLFLCGRRLLLVGLKQGLSRNASIPLILHLRDASGKEHHVPVQVPVTGPANQAVLAPLQEFELAEVAAPNNGVCWS